LDCGAEVFVWVGRVTQVEERKAACQAAEVMPLQKSFLHMLVELESLNLLIYSGVCYKSKKAKIYKDYQSYSRL